MPQVVDLTQPLHPGLVMWPGVPGPTFEVLVNIVPDGFYSRRVTFAEHTGTHFDAPCHMVEGTARLHEVDPSTLIRPAAVIDISDDVGDDADSVLTLAQVEAFERANGAIPTGGIVLLRTGWEERNTDPIRYAGQPGDLRFPAFGEEAARFLVERRQVVGVGVDTMGIDPGSSADFVVHRQVTHPAGVWHLEGLQNLKALPPLGATLFVGVLPLVDGSGSPARVLALVP
ncbi:MAG: cyclase family protein [Chloroflexota bacterium]